MKARKIDEIRTENRRVRDESDRQETSAVIELKRDATQGILTYFIGH